MSRPVPRSVLALFVLLPWFPQSFAVDFFNSTENDLALAVSGDEAWLARRAGKWGESGESSRLLYTTRDASGTWREPGPFHPVMAGGDGGEPFFHAPTQTLYFTSTRALAGIPDSKANIWFVRRGSDGWGEPEPLPAPINSSGEEYSPVLAGEHLYFASWRAGRGDLYQAYRTDSGWQVGLLGSALNSLTGEWNLWVSEDEQLMVFEASERPSNVSVPGDLYASLKDDHGRWLPAVPLHELNGKGSELNPRQVGDDLVYASSTEQGTHTDLYRVPLASVEAAVERAYELRLHAVARSSHRVGGFDLRSGARVNPLYIGPGPHLVAERGGTLAVAAYGQYPRPHEAPVDSMPGWVEEEGGAVLVAGTSEYRIRVDCIRPHGTAFDEKAERLWVSCEDKQGVVEIDLQQQPPTRTLRRTGKPGAHVLAWDDARQQLLVAHTTAGGVAFLESATAAVHFLPLAPGAEAIYLDQGRGEAWVTLGPGAALAVVDLDTRAEVARVKPDCVFPIDFAEDSSGRLWVACFGSSRLIAMDRESRTVLERLPLPSGPLNIHAHPTLPVLYASLPRQNRVVEISIPGRDITRSFAPGIEPDGLAITPSSTRAPGSR